MGNRASAGRTSQRLEFARWLAARKQAERAAASEKGRAARRKRSGTSARSKLSGSPKRRRSWTWWSIIWGFRATAAAVVLLVMALAWTLLTMPTPQPIVAGGDEDGLLVLAADGIPIAGKTRPQRFVPLAKLPPHLIDAVLATEDRRFYSHWGIDPWGIARAGLTNVLRGRAVQGGSTITQQLAKNLFLEPERTFARKIEELLYALALELRFSKDEILELYLNRVYFGAGAYGVAAAADTYFGRQPEALTLNQTALLAGLLKAPSRYAPTNSLELAKRRASTVLTAMVEAKVIDAAEAKAAAAAPFEFSVGRGLGADAGTAYATDWIAERLPVLVSGSTGKLTIHTTLDMTLQSQAEELVEHMLAQDGAKLGVSQAALVLMDHDGAIRALIGGRSYKASPFNRAVKAARQPGSAFKPMIYLAAIESGLTPDTILVDRPLRVGEWSPRNYKDHYLGPVSARQALAQSLNTVAVELFQTAGRDAVVDVARRLGIRSDLTHDASLALGTSEVTPLELGGAYLPIANGGRKAHPYLVTRIRDAKGITRYKRRTPVAERVVAAADAAALTDMLRAVVTEGTGQAAALNSVIAAGKTGTTQDSRDAWFVGFTDRYVAVVWVGNDDGKPMRGVTGGSLPARLWRDLMQVAHRSGSPEMARVTEGSTSASGASSLTDWLRSQLPRVR